MGTAQPWSWRTFFCVFLSHPQSLLPCKEAESQPITRSNYLPSASFWQPPPRFLPKLCFTNTLNPKGSKSPRQGSAGSGQLQDFPDAGEATGARFCPSSTLAPASSPRRGEGAGPLELQGAGG